MKLYKIILFILITSGLACKLSRSSLIENNSVPMLCKFHLECDYSNQENPDKTRCHPFTVSCERVLRLDYCEEKYTYTVDEKLSLKNQQQNEIEYIKKLSACEKYMNTR